MGRHDLSVISDLARAAAILIAMKHLCTSSEGAICLHRAHRRILMRLPQTKTF